MDIATSSLPVVVIGGGISGLTVAFRLAKASVPVRLVESSDHLGGLGMGADIDGVEIERFYHCIMPTDEHLLSLLGEIGLSDQIRWRPTTMGMIADGARYPFNTAVDLLRFSPLTISQRIRFGAVSVLLRQLGRGKDLDNTRTEDWLRGVYGNTIWERILQPLFGAKFGAAFGDVPALYLYQRLGREKNVATRGYPNGSYSSIVERLRTAIEASGGRVDTGTRVERVSSNRRGAMVQLGDSEPIVARGVVSTVPLPVLRSVADDELKSRLPELRLDYQGVVNAAFLLNKPLDGHYWAPVINCGTEFDGVVEMSTLTGIERYRGRSLVYAMHYCDRSSSLFDEPESSIADRWSRQLVSLYPDRLGDPTAIHTVKVFKAPFVEPVHSLGYGARVPDMQIPGTRVFLATTAQIYPDVTSWNSSVGLAERVAACVLNQRPSEELVVVMDREAS
jgi:protoporphyrinogen oxidase